MGSVLICGGAGYIGSHVNKYLNNFGIKTVVFDNLVYGHKEAVKWGEFVQGDLSNSEAINKVFEERQIDAVMHFAAYAYVGESVHDPEKYYLNNVANTLNLLRAMRNHGCDIMIFSSTCATYGIPKENPITENSVQNPINPYGASKLMVERIIKDYSKAYGLKYVVLRYFNAAGADPDCELGESHNPETHIIPILLDAAVDTSKVVKVFGNDYETSDGSCIRDYIHVVDLADAHLRGLEYIQNNGESDFFNLGNAKGTSVFQLIDTVKRITKRSFGVEIVGRRIGDPDILIGSSAKAMDVLGWKPMYSNIDIIVEDAWRWHQNRKF